MTEMSQDPNKAMKRREFLQLSAATAGAIGAGNISKASEILAQPGTRPKPLLIRRESRRCNGEYAGDWLSRVAFPMGGIGAGMICLDGTGSLSHVSVRNRPQLFNSPLTFAAICIKGRPNVARLLEGLPPDWKKMAAIPELAGSTFGLPHFRDAKFRACFPFATIDLSDREVPLTVKITGWSPFEAGDADNSSLPVAALEYEFTNKTKKTMDAVFSWNAQNFMATNKDANAVKPAPGGFMLWCSAPKERGWEDGALTATVDDPAVKVNHAWFRGGWFDSLTMAWNDVANGDCFDRPPITDGAPSPGASLFVPFQLAPRASKKIVVRLAWYVNQTNLRIGKDPEVNSAPTPGTYKPWYTSRFRSIEEVTSYWRERYDELRAKSQRFSNCFYDSTLPPEVIEAVAANLTILKSPTVLRQADGRLWGWEGCNNNEGCCAGSCMHVWNYAQSIPHLFPGLERTLRETEFGPSQDERGHQQFRSALPIRPLQHDFHAAADGQLGGIIKVYRDWRISGDTEWLRRLWPKVRTSLNYCIELWDPGHKGCVEEPHHNTYDIEFWGPDGMCTSFYLSALKAATLMGEALNDDVSLYTDLLNKGTIRMEEDLFDGEYFFQKVEWENLQAKNPISMPRANYSPEAVALLQQEGPKYQYGRGCLSDGVLGAWMAFVCGVAPVLDPKKVESHLKSVHRYNLKTDLTAHANPQRPGFACGDEGGLLLCTWPKGGQLSLPFPYSDEVWTGIEYQVASHLMSVGRVDEGLQIVRILRDRYDGRARNPFCEIECGYWYARAMSSYALLQGLTGARYDAIEKTLYLNPSIQGDFRSFISAETGYGTVGLKGGKPFLEVKSGTIEVKKIQFT